MALGHSDQHLRGAGGAAPALFPILQGAGANAQKGRESVLGKAEFSTSGRHLILAIDREGTRRPHFSALDRHRLHLGLFDGGRVRRYLTEDDNNGIKQRATRSPRRNPAAGRHQARAGV